MFKIITIPFNRNIKAFDEEILNLFLINKHIKQYRAEFFSDGNEPYWTVFIEYDPAVEQRSVHEKEKISFDLDETQNILMDKLKEWRKVRAEQEGVPVYLLGTNKELAAVVKAAPKTHEELSAIKGFGKSKVEKYGKDIIGIVNAFFQKQTKPQTQVQIQPQNLQEPKPA